MGRTTAQWNYKTATPTGVASDARVISYTYLPNGKTHTVTGPGGQQWSYAYDLHGNATTSVDPDAGTTTSTYDSSGDLLTSIDGNGQLLTFTYDKLGRKTAEYAGTNAPANLLNKWTYDTVPGGKGKAATSVSYVGGSTGMAFTQAVTGYNNRYEATGNSVTIPANVPVGEQPLVGTYSTTTSYNAISGSVASISYHADGGLPAETVYDTYNQNGTLTNMGGLATYLAATTSDAYGRVTRWTMGAMPSQVVVTDTYDQATARATEQTVDKESSATHVDDISNYFNAAGKITATRDVIDGTSTDLQCYTRNQLGQLTAAWSDTAGVTTAPSPSVPGIGSCTSATPSAATVGGPAAYWQTFGYDASANRATETDHDTTGNSANDVTRTLAYGGVGSQPDQLQSDAHTGPGAGTDTFTYDSAGQTKTRSISGVPAQSLTYTAASQTASVTDTGGNAAAYTYAADGSLLLQSDTVGGATTVRLYLGAEQLTLAAGTGQVSGQRFYTTTVGGPTEVRSSAGTLTYECGNGENTDLVDIDAGAAQAETRRYYTPYGTTRGPVPGSWADNLGYLGQPADPASGLDLLGARNYDPILGRFLQADPVFESADPNQLGGYAYAGDNPVDGSDANGKMFMCMSIDGEECASAIHASAGSSKSSDYEKGNEPLGPPSCSGRYCYGPAVNPTHFSTADDGFKYDPNASANAGDYASWAKWQTLGAGCSVISWFTDNGPDGCGSQSSKFYNYYMSGPGATDDQNYDLGAAYKQDPMVAQDINDEVNAAQNAAEALYMSSGSSNFSITSSARQNHYYPSTGNWQKAIGAYSIWGSANVTVTNGIATMTVTVHAEDRYNFNPGAQDIASGTPDNVNGRFAVLGWSSEGFNTHGTMTRTLSWPVDNSSCPTTIDTSGSGR